MDIKILEDVGLSKREAKTYLALLEIGSTTIGEIVKKTDIPSSKIYEVLDRLIEKGFANYLIKQHQKNFQASDPEIIISYLNERKKNLEKILPELKQKQKFSKDKQFVELYEGKQAIFNLIRGLVDKSKKGDEYLSFSVGTEHDDEEISDFYTNLTWRRKEKGLNIKVLTNEKVKEVYKKRYDKEVIKTINNRFTKFNFPQGIIVLNDKLIMINWNERPNAILMQSRLLANQYREFFYDLWKMAKE